MATLSIQFSVLIVTVTFMSSAATGCRDRFVWIADGSYSCKGLLDPADTVGLYPKRVYFCNTYKLTYCCQSCKLVNEELKKRELQNQALQANKPLVAENILPNVIV
ncbi:hypothetical protein CHS0354_030468 [Potamilus streckersoni]|uniref:Uncharacterized protein n=1 Tax=Potamilus streckersoni TaxID=2493646 RepID=A0AAE0RPE4_9BIVA|nr:hypothetical protein CHS0354_030468 [Potamilus streckersoni]